MDFQMMQIDHAFLHPRPCPAVPLPVHTLSADDMEQPLSRFGQVGESPLMPNPPRKGQPFRDAEACIVWAIIRLAADAEGQKKPADEAICSPHEVVKCLDRLYRQRRIDLHHVRILRLWAHRGRPPERHNPRERADWRVWREALDRLEWPLRSLGIVS